MIYLQIFSRSTQQTWRFTTHETSVKALLGISKKRKKNLQNHLRVSSKEYPAVNIKLSRNSLPNLIDRPPVAEFIIQ